MTDTLQTTPPSEQLQQLAETDYLLADSFAYAIMEQSGVDFVDEESELVSSILSYAEDSDSYAQSGLLDVDIEAALIGLGGQIAEMTPEDGSVITTLEDYIGRGAKLTPEQEETVLQNAEFEKFDTDIFTNRYVHRNVVSDVAKDIALHAMAGNEIDNDFVTSMREKTEAKIAELKDFLQNKNAGQHDTSQAVSKAREMLEKTLDYYKENDILETKRDEETESKSLLSGKISALGSTMLDIVVDAGKRTVEQFTPGKKARKRMRNIGMIGLVFVGSGAVVRTVTALENSASAENTLPPATAPPTTIEESFEPSDTETVTIEELVVAPAEVEPEAIETSTTLAETEVPVEVEPVVIIEEVASIPASTVLDIEPEPIVEEVQRTPITPEQQAIVDQRREKTLFEVVADGDQTLEGLAGQQVGSLKIDGICLDDIDVFVTHAVDPVNNPSILDGFDWNVLNSDSTMPPVVEGDLEAARERINPLYRARVDATPQQMCEMEGQSAYTERWVRTTRGSVEARNNSTHPSELQPSATLHPHSSLPGQPGVKLIESHRTTENAAFVNLDAIVPGQTAELSDGETEYSYNFVGFREVSPYISIEEIRAMSNGDEDMLVLSTCEDGSSVRLLAIFSRTV